MKTDKALDLQALRRGDRESFAAMVELYSDRLYRLAMRITNNPQEAEDTVQEAFLNAYQGLEGFEGRSSLGTWLYRITTNQALMKLRKRVPETVELDAPIQWPDGGESPRQLKDWCCLPEETFSTQEAQDVLEEAIEELSPALRAAFVLRDLHGRSTKETAEILDISQSAVKTRLMRARMQLRDGISEYFSEFVEASEHA